ncbi:transcriptional repressor [Anaerolineae bacterium CFX8]|nr:transcriptional repressor [Anaerolineae bacterium CFX8]
MMTFQEKASQAIREAGGRMTAQRQIILELLETSDEHLDAEELHRRARVQDTSISLATVYRTLNTLEEAGLVQQRYHSPEHSRKYVEPVHADEEYHFTCRNCHRVIAFHSELMQQLKQQLEAELNVQVLNACVCVDGLCPDCRVSS